MAKRLPTITIKQRITFLGPPSPESIARAREEYVDKLRQLKADLDAEPPTARFWPTYGGSSNDPTPPPGEVVFIPSIDKKGIKK